MKFVLATPHHVFAQLSVDKMGKDTKPKQVQAAQSSATRLVYLLLKLLMFRHHLRFSFQLKGPTYIRDTVLAEDTALLEIV